MPPLCRLDQFPLTDRNGGQELIFSSSGPDQSLVGGPSRSNRSILPHYFKVAVVLEDKTCPSTCYTSEPPEPVVLGNSGLDGSSQFVMLNSKLHSKLGMSLARYRIRCLHGRVTMSRYDA
jgi:hypothetical protein